VHNEVTPGYVLAEPHDSVVKNIMEIAAKLESPKIISDVIQKQKISTFSPEDNLSKILNKIKNNKFTQFPIFSSKGFEGILSENGITNWLAANIKEDIISISETKVADILLCEESKENFRFINRRTSIYEVEDYFQKFTNQGQSNGCLLILNNPKRLTNEQDILGIVTPWDLTEIDKYK
jgi:Predicted transcriptional regulator with C-terminal CBS domains